MNWRAAQQVLRAGLLGLPVVAVAATVWIGPSAAQGWWPWSQQAPPVPREPVYRGPPPAPIPPPATAPGPITAPRTSGSNNICLQLEQRLVSEGQRGQQGRSQLPRLDDEIRQTERAVSQAQMQLDRGDCFEQFLFVKSLRQTPSCQQASRQLDGARRRLSELTTQRQQMMGSGERSYQDDIIRELARNGCGQQYTQEARRRDAAGGLFGGWQTEDDGPKTENKFGNLPFATYRTVCVRLCDGYFFPVSFSTLPNHFQRDSDACTDRCKAPAELYYHQNPGADMRQAVSARSQTPYTSLKTAFRYTKELVPGCSCKEAEYNPVQTGEKKADNSGGVQPAAPQGATPREVRTTTR